MWGRGCACWAGVRFRRPYWAFLLEIIAVSRSGLELQAWGHLWVWGLGIPRLQEGSRIKPVYELTDLPSTANLRRDMRRRCLHDPGRGPSVHSSSCQVA